LNLSVVEDALLGLLARLRPNGAAPRDVDRAAKEPRHD
jgi:hypothetical protein